MALPKGYTEHQDIDSGAMYFIVSSIINEINVLDTDSLIRALVMPNPTTTTTPTPSKIFQECQSGQRWDVAEDGTGHLYFYTADGDSVWELPMPDHSFLAGIWKLQPFPWLAKKLFFTRGRFFERAVLPKQPSAERFFSLCSTLTIHA